MVDFDAVFEGNANNVISWMNGCSLYNFSILSFENNLLGHHRITSHHLLALLDISSFMGLYLDGNIALICNWTVYIDCILSGDCK